jgi:hypothetical protein
MIDLDRLRRQVMSNEEADQAVAELRAAREVYAELGPVLEPLRAMHGRLPGTRIPPCGWCRLILAYDKAIKAMGGK